LSSGIYFYQMKAGDYTSIKKMVYLKWFSNKYSKAKNY
jgi:hypothetical protein